MLPGVAMAGFSDQANNLAEVAVVPHPAVTVLFDLGEAPIVVDDGRGRQQRERVVAGLSPKGARGRGLAGGFTCLQVRLSPIVASIVLGAASELGGTVVTLDDLWGPDAALVHEQLRSAGSWNERFAIAQAALVRHWDADRAVDAEVYFCWQQMMTTLGQVRIAQLAADVGWSRKRLWSRFRSQIGVTPKHAAQLVRFDHAAHRLAAGESAAVVAAESGYVDQAHLHRDVVAFTGVTPTGVAESSFLAVDDIAWPAPALGPKKEMRVS